MTVSIQQAALNALGTFLSSKMPGVVISSDWPEPESPLPEKAITFIPSGTYTKEYLQPVVLSSVISPTNPKNRIYRWRVYEITQPIQIDIWSTYGPVCDSITADFERLVHTGNRTDIPVGPGLALQLGDGWSGWADYIFEEGQIINFPTAVRRSEFRSSLYGEIRACVYIDAESPKQAQIILKQKLNSIDFITDYKDTIVE